MDIYIEKKTYEKLCQYILATELEISGFGKVERINGELRITDVRIFEQEVTGGSTDLDMDDIAKFLIEENKKGEDVSKYKLWWHSHNTMSAYFSGTDTSTIAELGKSFDWLISIVGNHKEEFESRIDIFFPGKHTIEANLMIIGEERKIPKSIQEEVQKKVKEKEYPTYATKPKGGYTEDAWSGEDSCIKRRGTPMFDPQTGAYRYCSFKPGSVEEQEELQFEDRARQEIEDNIELKMTKKEETMVDNRIKYYLKNPNIFTQHRNGLESMCGGYQGCKSAIACEMCWIIEDELSTL